MGCRCFKMINAIVNIAHRNASYDTCLVNQIWVIVCLLDFDQNICCVPVRQVVIHGYKNKISEYIVLLTQPYDHLKPFGYVIKHFSVCTSYKKIVF